MLGSGHLTVIECSRNSKLSGTVRPLEWVPAPLPDLHMAQASERDPRMLLCGVGPTTEC